MGRAAKNKAARAAARAAIPATVPSITRVDELRAAAIVVGDLFGITPDCASAAGFLYEIAAELGQELCPRPVSVVGSDQRTGTQIVMGPRATALLGPDEAARLDDQRPNGKDTGHLVMTSDEHSLMLDPNMRQLGTYGIYAPSVIIEVNTEPDNHEWGFRAGGLTLRYLLDDDNEKLLPAYEKARVRFREEARRIVIDMRAGISIDQTVRRARQRLTT